MISVILLSFVALCHGDNDRGICSSEWNPICCPDPKHIEVPVDVYRPYSNVCDFSYGKNPQDSSEDAIACGYGTCPVCLCSMIYQPVCCNGVEHPNECEADCAGESRCTDGACPNTCPCTAEYLPVCCPNLGTEYSNPCGASCDGLTEAELIACHYGTCDKPEDICACTRDYAPICCGDVDYANECVARCEGIDTATCEQDACEICPCTLDYFPVCCPSQPAGGVGVTYGNSCTARCKRSAAELLQCYYGECPVCACPMIIAPVCCYGVEYGNQCEADCALAGGCTAGRCSSANSDSSPQGIEPVSSDESVEMKSKENKVECPEGCFANKGKCWYITDKNKACYDEEAANSAAFTVNSLRDCKCALDYAPVCCQGDVTYGNACEANCDLAKECVSGECESSVCICTREYFPVCCPAAEGAQWDEQYGNACTAACVKDTAELIACKYGVCEDQCACALNYAPVCCGGVTHSNECNARCSGVDDVGLCTEGECATVCALIYAPVCCDGIEYGNECMAEADGAAECDSGTCEEPCRCTHEYVPVCCGDTTFGNQCHAHCAGEDLVACEYGECEELCDCKEGKEAVCCDGNEYGNKCLAKCAGERMKRCEVGTCESSDSESYEAAAGSIMEAAVGETGSDTNVFYRYGLNVNTVLLAVILLSILTFICIYYKRTDPKHFKKQIIYDSDQ